MLLPSPEEADSGANTDAEFSGEMGEITREREFRHEVALTLKTIASRKCSLGNQVINA